MKPRVVQLAKYYPPERGGIENNAWALSRALREDYEVEVLAFGRGLRTVREHKDGVPLTRCGSFGMFRSAEVSPAAFAAVAGTRADLWYIHLPNPVMAAAFQATRRSGRVVLSWHNDIVRQKLLGRLLAPSVRALIRRADRIVVYTRNYIESSPFLREAPEKCVIIPHGTDPEGFALEGEALREAGALPPWADEAFLFVGRLAWYKGLDVMVRALARIGRGRAVVLGQGPERGPAEELARNLGVADRLHFEGGVSHARKVAWLHRCRCLLMPSTTTAEGFGQVQVEAHLCGRPVISCDIPSGVPHVNPHGETGLLVPPNDEAALAEAMAKLLDDAALRDRLGARARERALAEFSYPVMRRRTLELCGELLGTQPAPGTAS